jgi:predicted transposase YdaD
VKEPAGRSLLQTRVRYDAILKDLFQRDRPSLLDRFTGGVAIREALNTDFLAVDERRPDVLFLLVSGSLLHIEFQSANDSAMVYRMGRYAAMIGERYRDRQIHQVVLYTGQERLRMSASVDLGLTKLAYELHDIREFDAEDFLRSGRAGDYALALLASGGPEKLRRILVRVSKLPPARRSKLLSQLAIFAGLRKLETEFRMEITNMGSALYIKDHEILREWYAEAVAKGEAEGRAKGEAEGRVKGEAEGRVKGEAEGMSVLLTTQLRAKFGSVPRWAQDRLRRATPAQLERWAAKLLTAEKIEGVLGPRR